MKKAWCGVCGEELEGGGVHNKNNSSMNLSIQPISQKC